MTHTLLLLQMHLNHITDGTSQVLRKRHTTIIVSQEVRHLQREKALNNLISAVNKLWRARKAACRRAIDASLIRFRLDPGGSTYF